MEKRLSIALVVNLTPVQGQSSNGTELTYTDDISAHGARVVSRHPWEPGDVAEVTSLSDRLSLQGKVVYCENRGEGRFAIGLTFQNGGVFWPVYQRYATPSARTSLPLESEPVPK